MTHHLFDFARLAAKDRYKLLCGVVVPRPIAFVTSINEDGRINAAPFSFFNVFSEDPPQIVLGLQHRQIGEMKDTTRNIARACHFVVNMVDEPLAETMNLAATDLPPDVSEVDELSIATSPGVRQPVPWMTASPFALECRKMVSLSFAPTRELLIGEVLAVHARAELVDPATLYVDTAQYRPISRLAGSAYSRQGEVFKMKRLTLDEWRKRRG